MLLKIEIRDKNGKLVSSEEKRCKSFLIAFLKTLETQLRQTNVTIIDTGNVARSVGPHATNFWTIAGVGITTQGILVGTGTTPPTNSDYAMETLIAHGSGAGELSYGSQSHVTTGIVGENVDLQLVRAFTNSSGATITIREVGLANERSGPWYFLLIRDSVEKPVLDGQTATATYTLRTKA